MPFETTEHADVRGTFCYLFLLTPLCVFSMFHFLDWDALFRCKWRKLTWRFSFAMFWFVSSQIKLVWYVAHSLLQFYWTLSIKDILKLVISKLVVLDSHRKAVWQLARTWCLKQLIQIYPPPLLSRRCLQYCQDILEHQYKTHARA